MWEKLNIRKLIITVTIFAQWLENQIKLTRLSTLSICWTSIWKVTCRGKSLGGLATWSYLQLSVSFSRNSSWVRLSMLLGKAGQVSTEAFLLTLRCGVWDIDLKLVFTLISLHDPYKVLFRWGQSDKSYRFAKQFY